MGKFFRRPKTQNERKSDAAASSDAVESPLAIKARRRGTKKVGLPTERDDLKPAASSDRARGKATHSEARRAKAKEKSLRFR